MARDLADEVEKLLRSSDAGLKKKVGRTMLYGGEGSVL